MRNPVIVERDELQQLIENAVLAHQSAAAAHIRAAKIHQRTLLLASYIGQIIMAIHPMMLPEKGAFGMIDPKAWQVTAVVQGVLRDIDHMNNEVL